MSLFIFPILRSVWPKWPTDQIWSVWPNTHKYEMDWFLWKFQNCCFKSIRKLWSVEEGMFWKLQFFSVLCLMKKNGTKALHFWADISKTPQWILWMQLFFFFLSHELPELKPNQDSWLDWPQHESLVVIAVRALFVEAKGQIQQIPIFVPVSLWP